MKSKKYIPNSAKNPNVLESVMDLKGLYTDNTVPISKEEKIQGILIFSNSFPIRRINKNAIPKNKYIFTIFNLIKNRLYLILFMGCILIFIDRLLI